MSKTLSGIGLGYRPDFYDKALEHQIDEVDFYEIVSENFMTGGGRPRRCLAELRERFPIVMHGVSLSIGSPDPLNTQYLQALKKLIEFVEPEFVSDHLSWSSYQGVHTHDLLPIPMTYKQLQMIGERIDAVQTFLGRRLYLENPSAYIIFKDNDYDEASFFAELIKRSGCGVLLDLNNLYVNQKNLGYQSEAYLEHFRSQDIAYFHLAGHSIQENIRIDTHDQEICHGVWELYQHAVRLFPNVPTIIERDDTVPSFEKILDEVQLARAFRQKELEVQPLIAKTCVSTELPLIRSEVSDLNRDYFAGLIDHLQQQEDPKIPPIDAGELIQGGLPLASISGLKIYREAFFLRLRDCLKVMFPTLSNLISGDAFDELTRAYLGFYPPSHYNLVHMGEQLPHFLESDVGQGFSTYAADVLASIARLEWTIEYLYDRPEPEKILEAESLGFIDQNQWQSVRFRSTETCDVVRSPYDLKAIFEAVAASEQIEPVPMNMALNYVVYRVNEDIFWQELAPGEAEFLFDLRSTSFYCAVQNIVSRQGLSLDMAIQQGMNWLGQQITRRGLTDFVWESVGPVRDP